MGTSQVALAVQNLLASVGDGRDEGSGTRGSWVGKIFWSRKWQLTKVFLPEKFHGQRNLVG